jgi:hypothetical protein
MKRALFKLGKQFTVRSATSSENWQIDVDVPKWEETDDWHFAWSKFENSDVSEAAPGTTIIVNNLREIVATNFASQRFENNLRSLLKSKHRQFISDGLEIVLNGAHLEATSIMLLLNNTIAPGIDTETYSESDKATSVVVKIIAGIGDSRPRDAGWYIICNGRVILEADRRPETGWGYAEEQADRILIPSFHNQFARFRGIVTFDSADSSRVPWNTTKTDIDQDNAIWRKSFEKMISMMKPVIDFLNDLDSDIDEYTRDKSPLYALVAKTPQVKTETLPKVAEFKAPKRGDFVKGPRYIKIQYSKPEDDIETLKDALNLRSATAVGERTFDLALNRYKSK